MEIRASKSAHALLPALAPIMNTRAPNGGSCAARLPDSALRSVIQKGMLILSVKQNVMLSEAATRVQFPTVGCVLSDGRKKYGR